MKVLKIIYIYVKGYGFLSFAKNIATHATKVAKNTRNKYSQKLLDSAKKSRSGAYTVTTASKRAIQTTLEATGDLIFHKTADKITSLSKKIFTK